MTPGTDDVECEVDEKPDDHNAPKSRLGRRASACSISSDSNEGDQTWTESMDLREAKYTAEHYEETQPTAEHNDQAHPTEPGPPPLQGQLTEQELEATARMQMPVEVRSEYARTFRLFDCDNSGSISADEVQRIFIAAGFDPTMASLMANQLLANADADGDGEVNIDEFLDHSATTEWENSTEDTKQYVARLRDMNHEFDDAIQSLKHKDPG